VNKNGQTVLMKNDNHDILKIFLDAGADVNAKDNKGITALMVQAKSNKDTKVLRLLLDAGADIHAKDNEGKTALYHGIINLNFEAVEFLIQSGADVNAADNNGKTAIETMPIFPRSADMIRMLQKNGATGTPEAGWETRKFRVIY
jgi:ankyrin repeat protein